MLKFICYPKCTTCQRAKKWLDDNKQEYELRDIKLDNPTPQELTEWYRKSGLPIKKFFNTSGLLYKSLDLKNKLPEMSEDEMLKLLATDGQENASHKYTSEQVKKMIERHKEKYGWEFLFIGANIDAVETASRYGIGADRAVNYNADSEGTHILYESVAKAVCNVRASAPLSADWSEDINADFQRRGKKNK